MKDSNDMKTLTLEWTKAQPAVTRFVRSFVKNQADAHDVVQEIALTIVDKFDKYDRDKPFIGWAFGIARNLIKAHFRKQLKQVNTVINEEAIERVSDAIEAIQPELEDMKEALQGCLKRVPKQERLMLSLQYSENLKPAKIAAKIGKSPNHVAVILHRVRTGLRQCVERKIQAAS